VHLKHEIVIQNSHAELLYANRRYQITSFSFLSKFTSADMTLLFLFINSTVSTFEITKQFQNILKAVSQTKRLCMDDEATHIQLAQVQRRADWIKSRCKQLTAFKMAGKATSHVSE
jgi:hypothetical protein